VGWTRRSIVWEDLESETLAAKDPVKQLATFAMINHQKLLAMR
jgi:hypothetical protein